MKESVLDFHNTQNVKRLLFLLQLLAWVARSTKMIFWCDHTLQIAQYCAEKVAGRMTHSSASA